MSTDMVTDNSSGGVPPSPLAGRDATLVKCPNPACGRENPSSKKFCGDCGSPLVRVTPERRQLTVLFCDLVDSTALARRLDPEDLRELIRSYHAACAGAIEPYAGRIAQYLGDGVLVYFGYPNAHEDDAARAVRAGLAILDAIQELNTGQRAQHLQVRVGIHTGQVVTDRIGAGGRQEELALGETPNVASRIQEKAEPGTVYLSAATHHLVVGLFESVDQGDYQFKGLATPVRLYRAFAASAASDRFDAAVQTGLTPLVGRQEELALLRARWDQAKEVQGNVAFLSGEPGIGKSRLVRELREQIVDDGGVVVVFRCSAYYQTSALHPVIDYLNQWLGIASGDSIDTKLMKLRGVLNHYPVPQADAEPLLAALLSWPHPDQGILVALSPQRQRQRIQEILIALLVEIANRQPVFCVWEDLHWSDPSTIELLSLFLDQIQTGRIFALCVFRPEFVPPWGSRSSHTHLTVSRLTQRQAEQLVKNVTRGLVLPQEVIVQVVAKTDGVPLFVEELTKSLAESEALTTVDGHYQLTTSLANLAIPSTLSDSLTARLDRLGSAKEVAQLGSAIGREFSFDLLRAISRLDESALKAALADLITAELIYQRGRPSGASYLFKHSLIQDTAYNLLLKSTRQQLHTDIAQVIEREFPETVASQPELLAHHFTKAGMPAQAVTWWQRAGQRALERSSNTEAIHHLRAGLAILSEWPDAPTRDPMELMLQATLGAALMATRGYAAPEVEAVYKRVSVLCEQIGETVRPYPALWGLWAYYFTTANLRESRLLGERFVASAQTQDEAVPTVVSHACLGYTLFWLGDFPAALEQLSEGCARYEPDQHLSHISMYGLDCGTASAALMACSQWMLGYPDQARASMKIALEAAEKNAHPISLALVLFYSAVLYQSLGDREETAKWAARIEALSLEQGFPYWLALGTILRVWAGTQSAYAESMAAMEQGFQLRNDIGAHLVKPYCMALLAEVHVRKGQSARALEVIGEALSLVGTTAERHWEAELYRLQGVVASQANTSNLLDTGCDAEQSILKALEVAVLLSARSLELRAAIDYARLLLGQGRKLEARRRLEEVYLWFTEGFDTTDLCTAKALLEELS